MNRELIDKVRLMLDSIDFDKLYMTGPLESDQSVIIRMSDSDETILHLLQRFLLSRAVKDDKMEYHYYLLTRSDNDLYNCAISNGFCIDVSNPVVLSQLFEHPDEVSDWYKEVLYEYLLTESKKSPNDPFKKTEELTYCELVFNFMIEDSPLRSELSALREYNELAQSINFIVNLKGSVKFDEIASEVRGAANGIISAFKSCNPRMVLVKAAILSDNRTPANIREFVATPNRENLRRVMLTIGFDGFLSFINEKFESIKLPEWC